MKKFAAVLAVLGMMMLGGACASQVDDSEDDAVQQDDSATGSAVDALHCRRVCHSVWTIRNGRRVRGTVCHRVCN
jgi:protein involved in sex pheromone biosynthesis